MTQGGNIQVSMNPQVASATGRGLARLGQTLGQLGVDAANMMEATKQAEDDKVRIETRESWKNAAAEQETWELANPDAALQFQEKWSERSQKLSADLDQMDVSKDFKEELRLELLQHNGNTNREVGRRANNLVFRNREQVADISFSAMLEDKDIMGARAFLESPEAKRIYSPAEIALRENKIKQREETIQWEGHYTRIKGEPLTELELIRERAAEYADLEQSELDKLESYAMKVINIYEHEEVNELYTILEQDAEMTVVKFDELINSGEYDHIESSRREKLRNSIERMEPPTIEEEEAAMKLIDELGKAEQEGLSENEYLKKFRKAQDAVISASHPSYNGYLKERLNWYSPNKKGRGSDNLKKANHAMILEDVRATLNDMEEMGKFGYKSIDPLTVGQKKRDVLYKMQSWLRQQDGQVTPKEAREKLINLHTGEKDKEYLRKSARPALFVPNTDVKSIRDQLRGKKTSSNKKPDTSVAYSSEGLPRDRGDKAPTNSLLPDKNQKRTWRSNF